jgi:CubicO group peptidase (beta-lactamase class C family)
MKKIMLLALTVLSFTACKKSHSDMGDNAGDSYYYPPLSGDTWETKSAASAGWDETQLQSAFDYAATKNTYGLIVLHHGKIVKEQYWNGWTKDTRYYLASAGKSIVGFVTGIAQQDGIIHINDKTSTYLGTGWTSLPPAKEDLVTIKNQLTMTTGLDDAVPDPDCMTPACLVYKADAGTRWAYHNAPYRLMQDVLSAASGQTWNAYCKEKLFDKIGISGAFWLNYVMYCTTRDAARIGSLILRKGEWDGVKLLTDPNYFTSMTTTSQNKNLSYGYLWWLNGKASCMVPQSQLVIPTSLVPNAPADMIMALGKGDKKIYVIPSLDAVVVRLGDDAGASMLGPSSFDNELWAKLKLAMKY